MTTVTTDPGSSAVDEARLANAIRALAMDAVQKANAGHPGMPMGMADVATVLFRRHLRFDAADPHWPDRDRFVLSAGHGSMLLYALLYLTGVEDMSIDDLRNFRQLGSKTAGHPEYGYADGIETTTGPLGQGLANGVGLALAERLMNARFGNALVDHRTWVIAGDGCMMEGISHEAASLAGHLGLGRLNVLYDDNHISIDGPTSLAFSDDVHKRFEAYGWHVLTVDGHDRQALDDAMMAAKAEIDRPTLIACRTTIGFGAPTKAGTSATHGSPLGEEEVAGARKTLDWPYPAFEIPDDILSAWRAIGAAGRGEREAWIARLDSTDDELGDAFNQALEGDLPPGWREALNAHIAELIESKPKVATRKASEEVLNVLLPVIPTLYGGSADLTPSNNTKVKGMQDVTREDYSGHYIRYGVREHAMGAVMNGLALHRGIIPYGGTFLCFTDYLRPTLRLAAHMGVRVIHVATHDSIGLGEDGPTHQPVEHLASLRAIPHVRVLRPADSVETAECWAIAIERRDGPSILALSRQNLPAVRTRPDDVHTSFKGGYVLAEAEGGARKVTIIATGSEVQIALAARDTLQGEGIPTAVVSMPCVEIFLEQDAAWRDAVLGTGVRLAVEAAVPFGWSRLLASEDDMIGMRGFGASGKIEDLYPHFGITAEAVVERAKAHL
ncbi:transketolase [Marinivivus vitaminiproducens]|uniref:transketolase n=1 Tax=Marinivivus vitaminiproducens TaxID=3035935 RepID=UPI00279E640C|nr:transketolase [Geminicoccaceae bacterium SCSIO 64248]